MSGTSLDGIDIAIIEAKPQELVKRLGWHFSPYPDTLKKELFSIMDHFRSGNPVPTDALANTLADLNAKVIKEALKNANLTTEDIDLIGYHGQTIWHDPAKGETIQLGNAERLAEQLGIDTVYDFRSNDIHHGGQGAPLVPLYHQVLFNDLPKPTVVLNIGGVGNLTYLDDDTIIAFDFGPGNALIDDAMRHFGLGEYDKEGTIAAMGFPCVDWVNRFVSNPYFTKAWPKSLDRASFADLYDDLIARKLSVEDTIASATMATALSVKMALELLPQRPEHWVVCGGGRHNPTLIQYIADAVDSPIYSSDVYGVNGDAVESEAFAYLAILSVNGLPLTLPSTTGCEIPCTGGTLIKI